MSSVDDDPADCFCALFDSLNPAPFRDGRALDWQADATTRTAAEEVAAAVRKGAFTRQSADISIAAAADPARRRFEILRGLDTSLAQAHPLYGTPSPGALGKVADRYLERGRFNSGRVNGALWPRFSLGADGAAALEEPQAAFVHVVRISPETLAQVERNVLEEPFGTGPATRAALRFACAPIFETYEDVEFQAPAVGYALRPNRSRVSGRPARAVAAMDASGAAVGCAPEGTLDEQLLGEWRSAAGAPRPAGSMLDFVLAGTGPVGGAIVGPRGANEAVVLERLTGGEILRQRKRSRFTMRSGQIDDWRLSTHLGRGPSTEDIVLGDRLSILECSLGRVAVAVCEDVARLPQFGPTITDAGVSLLLVPVFSKELREHYWEDVAAKAYANGIGAQVLIINSLAVAHARSSVVPPLPGGPVDNPIWHTAMLRGGQFYPGRCDTAADVVVVPAP